MGISKLEENENPKSKKALKCSTQNFSKEMARVKQIVGNIGEVCVMSERDVTHQ